MNGCFGDAGLNHVDMFMTFASASDLVLGSFEDSDPRNQEISKSNEALLEDLTQQEPPLRIHHVPMPSQCPNSWASCENNPNRILRTFLNGIYIPGPGKYIMPTYQ